MSEKQNETLPAQVVEHSVAREMRDELTVEDLIGQVQLIQAVMEGVMQDGTHYGVIPGTGDKPTLLKPGAEKLCATFRLAPEYEIVDSERSEDLIYYRVRCKLRHIPSGLYYGEGIGSCASRERKWRWRTAKPKCPECDYSPVRKSKHGDEYYCWRKKGGCGATWPLGAEEIEGQDIGQVERDPYDVDNTLLKMAQKRAHVAATLSATAASDIFTQDVEDMPEFSSSHGGGNNKAQPQDQGGSRSRASDPALRPTQPPPEKSPFKDQAPQGHLRNEDYAQIFRDLATVLGFRGNEGDGHRTRVYRKVADSLEDLDRQVVTISTDNLTDISGVGEKSAEKIKEITSLGYLRELDHLRFNLLRRSLRGIPDEDDFERAVEMLDLTDEEKELIFTDWDDEALSQEVEDEHKQIVMDLANRMGLGRDDFLEIADEAGMTKSASLANLIEMAMRIRAYTLPIEKMKTILKMEVPF